MIEEIKKPLKKTLVVKEDGDDSTTSSGIILVNGKNKREKTARAIVINVSDDLLDRYSIGDVVVYPKYRKQDDSKVFVLKHSDIMGKFNEKF